MTARDQTIRLCAVPQVASAREGRDALSGWATSPGNRPLDRDFCALAAAALPPPANEFLIAQE